MHVSNPRINGLIEQLVNFWVVYRGNALEMHCPSYRLFCSCIFFKCQIIVYLFIVIHYLG